MTPEEFVHNFYLEKKNYLQSSFSNNEESEVSKLISDLNLDTEKTERLRQIINGVLTDTFYTILLGLDGAASIGKNQEVYSISDEDGNQLSDGDIEEYAYEYFHNNKFELDNSKADFIATITYKTAEENGRETAAASGYRPQVKFGFEERTTSGLQRFIDRDLAFPGDTIDAEIYLLSPHFFKHKLKEGMKFEIIEGLKIMGNGKIKHIINSELNAE